MLKQEPFNVLFWDQLLFVIYIDHLPDLLISNPKFFADGTFLFSVLESINSIGYNSKYDLMKRRDWDHH